MTKDLSQRGFDTPRYKKSGSLSHQFIIAIPYKAIAAMRNLFKLCSEFYYFNCSFFFASPKKETKKTRLTNFSIKFYEAFASIFTFEFSWPFSNYREACHSVQGDSRDAESV